MRLWHYELIPFLPKSQLLAQWRELNSIFKKQDKHILINYIYEYPKEDLLVYTMIVLTWLTYRKIKYNLDNFNTYFKDMDTPDNFRYPFKNHHTNRYLIQCFYNLQEKYDRGQKDFDSKTYSKLENFIETYYKEYFKGDIKEIIKEN